MCHDLVFLSLSACVIIYNVSSHYLAIHKYYLIALFCIYIIVTSLTYWANTASIFLYLRGALVLCLVSFVNYCQGFNVKQVLPDLNLP